MIKTASHWRRDHSNNLTDVTDINDSSQVGLRQAEVQKADSALGTNP